MGSTKYPVVLVHGMMVKNFRIYPAFRGIAGFLREQGVRVYVSNQDAIGSVETNAEQLKEEILSILETEKCEKVNLIAHSKGGVDSRYMITHLDMADRVASLTTLSSPHRGSGLSTKLLRMPKFLAKTIAFFANTYFRILRDRQPDMLTLGQELTIDSMKEFNANTPDAPSVYYQSYSSTFPRKKAFLLYLPYRFSRHCEQGESDGMVSVASSQWANYQGHLDEPTDHFLMAGMYGSKRKLAKVKQFYWHIICQLKEMGF